jgi:hypothetical protein
MSSIPLITGATNVLKIKPNSSYVSNNLTSVDNLYDIANLTASKYATWRGVATTAAKVGVVASSSGTEVGRYIDANYSIGTSTGSLWFLGEAQQNKSFYMQTGATLNKSNSSSIFTGRGLVHSMGLNEASAPVIDRCGLYSTTPSAVTYNQTSIIGKGIKFAASSYILSPSGKYFNSLTSYNLNTLVKITTVGTPQSIMSRDNGAGDLWVFFTGPVCNIRISGTAQAVFTITGLISNDTYFLLSVIYDGTQPTNATRIKAYINGVQQVLSFPAAPVPASIPVSNSTSFYLGDAYDGGLIGTVDEHRVGTSIMSSEEPLWRYNQWFNQASYWTTTIQPIITAVSSLGGKNWRIDGSGFKPGTTSPYGTINGVSYTVSAGSTDTSFTIVEGNGTPPGSGTFTVYNSDGEHDYTPIISGTPRTVVVDVSPTNFIGMPTSSNFSTGNNQHLNTGYANPKGDQVDNSAGANSADGTEGGNPIRPIRGGGGSNLRMYSKPSWLHL